MIHGCDPRYSQDCEYEFAGPSISSDRVCKKVTSCDFDCEFMSAEPTAYSNRACSRLTFCEPVPTQGCAVCDAASCPDCGEYMAADSVMVDDDGCNKAVVMAAGNRNNKSWRDKNASLILASSSGVLSFYFLGFSLCV